MPSKQLPFAGFLVCHTSERPKIVDGLKLLITYAAYARSNKVSKSKPPKHTPAWIPKYHNFNYFLERCHASRATDVVAARLDHAHEGLVRVALARERHRPGRHALARG